MADYAANGVPADLVEAAKRREIADAEFRRNSISGLAATWSEALASEGRNSPDDDVEAMKRGHRGGCKPRRQALSGGPSVDHGGAQAGCPPARPWPPADLAAAEQATAAPTQTGRTACRGPSSQLLTLEMPPPPQPATTDVTLPNGLRLIVRTAKVTPTVTVVGNIRHDPQMEAPTAKDGVDRVLDDLFSYGTKTLDRLAFQKALDDHRRE